jgi:hypothetical protein
VSRGGGLPAAMAPARQATAGARGGKRRGADAQDAATARHGAPPRQWLVMVDWHDGDGVERAVLRHGAVVVACAHA